MSVYIVFFFIQAEDGILDLVRSRRHGNVYKRQEMAVVETIEAKDRRNNRVQAAMQSLATKENTTKVPRK